MIADLKPYSEYRESGHEWLSLLPAHWKLLRAKCLFREVDERSKTGREELLSVSHITGVTPRSQKTVTMFLAKSNVGYKICRPGDVVINTMWAWMGALGVARHIGIVSPSYGVYRPLAGCGIQSRYADYLLRTPTYAAEYQRCSTGVNSSRLRLYPEHFLRVPVVVPPLSEQAVIVRFLDWAKGRLDRAIQAKRKVIALLDEQKQAIIHRAVTRGLDPNAKFKESGISWLGKVPAHWEVKRLKWATRLQRGYDLPAEQRIPGPFPVVSSGGVIDTHYKARSSGPGVVMGRYGSTDAVFFLESDFWPHNTALFVTDFQGNRPRWCYFVLRTISKADHSGKSAVPGVDRKDLFDIYVPVPLPSEQDSIVASIENASTDLNHALSTTEREISLLREFRTRLIADVVTGKLDVREVVKRLPEESDATATFEDIDADLDIEDDSDEIIDQAEA